LPLRSDLLSIVRAFDVDILYWLIPVAIFLLTIAIVAFVYAVKSDQYSDLESPAYKILFDDDSPANNSSAAKENENDQPENNAITQKSGERKRESE